jgi:hypothetical protein
MQCVVGGKLLQAGACCFYEKAAVAALESCMAAQLSRCCVMDVAYMKALLHMSWCLVVPSCRLLH